MTDEMLVITKVEYMADPSRWLRLSAGDQQVGIADTDGKLLMILGTGPYTEEEKEAARLKLEEIDRRLAEMPPARVEDCDTSWID